MSSKPIHDRPQAPKRRGSRSAGWEITHFSTRATASKRQNSRTSHPAAGTVAPANARVPNATTRAALKEDLSGAKRHSSAAALFADLESKP